MVECRDWQSTLRRASYRGVSFFVDTDQIETGRRLVVHEFPHKDLPYVEDLGRKANRISVTAYVTGDDVEGHEQALRAACEKGGAARLELPMARFSAHCEDCRRDYNRDKLGYIAFSLRFVRDGTGSGPFPLLSLARGIEFAAAGIGASIAAAFGATFATLGKPSYVADAAAGTVQGFFEDFDAALRTQPLAPEAMASLTVQVADAHANADTLVAVGAQPATYTAARFVAPGAAATGEALVGLIGGFFETARSALSGQTAVIFARGFADWGEELQGPGLSAGANQILANAAAIRLCVRASALAQYATALVLAEYTDVREARQARADAAEFFEAQLESIRSWEDYAVWKELSDLRAKVAQHFQQMITNMAPVLIVEAPALMPSLWWANRLYGDAGRAGELVARNGIKHGLFMPTEFEALAT